MLEHKLIRPDLLEVKEIMMGFDGTKISYWYYDIKNWIVSRHGKEGDKPSIKMSTSAIMWARVHYLPKIGIPFE